MTVKDTLYSSLIRYSTLYENKWQVYHQLFSTYGNGYEWINGELVELIPAKRGYDENGYRKTIQPTLAKLGIKKRDIPERVKKEAEDFTPIFYSWFPYRLESDRKKFAENFYPTYVKMVELHNAKCDDDYVEPAIDSETEEIVDDIMKDCFPNYDKTKLARTKLKPMILLSKEEYIEREVNAVPQKTPLLFEKDKTIEDYLMMTQSLKYSYVYNYPKDIKPDWAEARQEWEDYLKSVGCWLKE